MNNHTGELLYPPLRRTCHGRPCYTMQEAFDRAVMSERCPTCGWFHLLIEIKQPENHRPQLKTRG